MNTTRLEIIMILTLTVAGQALCGEASPSQIENNQLSVRIKAIENSEDNKTIDGLVSDLLEVCSQTDELYGRWANDILPIVEKRIRHILRTPRKGMSKGGRDAMLDFAQRLGNVRMLRIPTYQYVPESPNGIGITALAHSKTPGLMNPEMIEEPELKKEVEQKWKEWRKKQLVYSVQSFLKREDFNFTRDFMKAAREYLSAHSDDRKFLEEAKTLARLTAEEQKQLESEISPTRQVPTQK